MWKIIRLILLCSPILIAGMIFRSDNKFFNDQFNPYKRIKNSKKEERIANTMFFATRYDYLRIAKSILDDWNNDTCMGKYLKKIYENRIPKGNFDQRFELSDSFSGTKSYAGFFHTDYQGMKNRKVMGMSGYGGIEIIIDFDRSRIIVIHSIHQNYNWRKIAYSVIKKGN